MVGLTSVKTPLAAGPAGMAAKSSGGGMSICVEKYSKRIFKANQMSKSSNLNNDISTVVVGSSTYMYLL